MDKSEIPRYQWVLREWIEHAAGDIRFRTPYCIKALEDWSAKNSFIIDWITIGQVWLENESITQYLDPNTTAECKKLYERFERFEARYNPVSEENDRLPPWEQDRISSEMWNTEFSDPECLEIYRAKLELEKQILDILRRRDNIVSTDRVN